MNRSRLNLLLLTIVLALGAAAYVAHRDKAKPKGTLTAIAPEGVTKIVVEWPGSPTIALEKTAKEWLLTAPVQSAADRFEAVGATSLASTEVQSTLDDGELDLKELGLAPPSHTVTLNGTRIEFGGSDALQSRRYVRVEGKVMLIDDPASQAFDKDYSELVAKELLAPADELVRIELPGLVLSKGADGIWTAPVGTANATPAAVKALTDGWKSARAQWNEPADGAAPSGDTLRLRLADGRIQSYVIAATDPQLALYDPALKIRRVLSKEMVEVLLKLAPARPAAASVSAPAH